MARPRLLVVGPLPPPVHGVTVSTGFVLANPVLRERFDVVHVDTSDHREAGTIERWDWQNLASGFRAALRLLRLTFGARGMVYLPLSQGTGGLLRDGLLIHIAALRRMRVAGHLRGGEIHHYLRGLPRPLRWWMHLTFRRLASIGVMGDSLRFIFDGVVAPDRLAVVPNGTPDPGYRPRERDPATVLFLSGLRERKGAVLAMEAAALVLAERPDARFVFAGWFIDPETEARLRAAAAGLGPAVEFTGEVAGPAKQELLERSTLLLFPPIEPEGHPRVILEGIAAGIPIVTTDQGAISETVVDGESAFVLDRPDAAALAERILRLLGDEALRDRMGKAARARFEAEYTQARADEKLADWLSAVARRAGLNAPQRG